MKIYEFFSLCISRITPGGRQNRLSPANGTELQNCACWEIC